MATLDQKEWTNELCNLFKSYLAWLQKNEQNCLKNQPTVQMSCKAMAVITLFLKHSELDTLWVRYIRTSRITQP